MSTIPDIKQTVRPRLVSRTWFGVAAPATRPIFGRYSVGVVIASGVVGVFAFPPYDLWPLAVLAVAMISLALTGVRSRTGVLYGFLFGLAFFLPLLHWSGTYVGALPWILLAVSQAGFVALLGAVIPIAQRMPLWPIWVAVLWVGDEALRSRVPFGGFPWGRLAFSQADSPFTAFAALGGAPLMTFAVALTGCLLACFIRLMFVERDFRSGAWALSAVVVIPLGGMLVWLGVPDGRSDDHTVVAVVQGNVPRLGLDFNEQRRAVLDNHVRETQELAARVRAGQQPQPELVIWPENASDINPLTDPDARAAIDRAVDAINAPILVGAILDGPDDKVLNVGIVWSPDTGPGEQYVKRHPVPFGEYVPLRPLARTITDSVDLVERDMAAGTEPGVLQIGPVTLGDVICFEVAYDNLVRDAVIHGGQLLVVQTNNATFGRSNETHQQLAMGQIRAVEHGRTVLVAATSGVSAVIRPDGTVVEKSDVFTADAFDLSVPIRESRTLATRVGAWPERLLTSIGIVVVLMAFIRSKRERRMTTSEEETQ